MLMSRGTVKRMYHIETSGAGRRPPRSGNKSSMAIGVCGSSVGSGAALPFRRSSLVCLAAVCLLAHSWAPDARASPETGSVLHVIAVGAGAVDTMTAEIRRVTGEAGAAPVSGPPLKQARVIRSRVSFAGLAAGLYEVRLLEGDAVPTSGIARLSGSGEDICLGIPCARGAHTLRGQAIWSDGRVFAGWIRVTRPRFFSSHFASSDGEMWVETDEGGAFQLPFLPLGRYGVGARARDGSFYSPRRYVVSVPQEGVSHTFVVDADGGVTRGRLLDEVTGGAIGGAELAVYDVGAPDVLARGHSEHDGSFVLRFPRSTVPELLVDASGYSTLWMPLHPGTTEREVRLVQAGSITGRVVRQGDGTAVEGAVVCARWGALGEDLQVQRTATTDAHGRFRIPDAVVGENRVFVLGGGWIHCNGLEPWDGTEGRAIRVEVRAGASNSVDVTVTRAAGFRLQVGGGPPGPARFAEVTLTPEIPFAMWGNPWAHPARPMWSVHTSRDGEALLRNLVPGLSYRATIHLSGETRSLMIPPVSGGDVTSLQVESDSRTLDCREATKMRWNRLSGSSITGRLSGPAQFKGWLVQVCARAVDADGDLVVGPPAACLDLPCEGDFVLRGLQEGRPYVLVASLHLVGRLALEAIATAVGGAANPVKLKLDRSGRARYHSASVLVRDPTGALVPRAIVRIYEQEDATARPDELPATAGVRSGVAEFQADPKAEKTWIEVVQPQDDMGQTLPLGGTLVGPFGLGVLPDVVTLGHSRTLRGRVVDPSGSGVHGARLYALPLRVAGEGHRDARVGGVQATGISREDGRFEIAGLGKIHYQLAVIPPPEFAWPLMYPVDVTSEAESILQLEPARTVGVRVLDAAGKPVVGASLEVWWRELDGPLSAIRSAGQSSLPSASSTLAAARSWMTDSSGTAVIAGLDARRPYILAISPPEGRPDLAAVSLPGWRTDVTVVTLRGP